MRNYYCGDCNECRRKVYVNTVTFADGTVTINLPGAVRYNDGCKFCFVITTTLPAATINAPVVATVGTGTATFPVLDRCGDQVVAQQLTPRRRFPFRVRTTATSGSIVLLCDLDEVDIERLAALNDA